MIIAEDVQRAIDKLPLSDLVKESSEVPKPGAPVVLTDAEVVVLCDLLRNVEVNNGHYGVQVAFLKRTGKKLSQSDVVAVDCMRVEKAAKLAAPAPKVGEVGLDEPDPRE